MAEFRIVGTRNMNIGTIVRIVYDVLMQEVASDEELLAFVKEQVLKEEQKVNAIGFFFWTPEQVVGQEIAQAGIDWAPHGKWEEAGLVKTGDYSTHEYVLTRFLLPAARKVPLNGRQHGLNPWVRDERGGSIPLPSASELR